MSSLKRLKDEQQLILDRLADQEVLSRKLFERLMKSSSPETEANNGLLGSVEASNIFDLLNRKSQSNQMTLTNRVTTAMIPSLDSTGQHSKGLLDVAMETLFGTKYSAYALLFMAVFLLVIFIFGFCLLCCCFTRLSSCYIRIFRCKKPSKNSSCCFLN